MAKVREEKPLALQARQGFLVELSNRQRTNALLVGCPLVWTPERRRLPLTDPCIHGLSGLARMVATSLTLNVSSLLRSSTSAPIARSCARFSALS